GEGLGSHHRAQRLFDLAGLGEAPELLLGEDQPVVDSDFKDASGATDQLRLYAEFALQVFRQTGGSRVIVSHPAVVDPHVGHVPSFPGQSYDTPRDRPGRRSCRSWTTL